MGSIPLPALAIQPQQQQTDPVTKFMQMRAAMQESQLRASQIQQSQQATQLQQLDLDSQRATMKAFTDAEGDPDQTMKLAAKYGAKPQALIQLQNGFLDQKSKTLDLVQKQGAEAKRQADLMAGAHDTVAAGAPEDRPQLYQQQLQGLQKEGVDISQMPPSYPGDDHFKFLGAVVKGHAQGVDEALKTSETRKNATQAALDQIKVNLSKNSKPGDFDSVIDQATATNPANRPLAMRTKALVNFALQRGDIESANKAISQMSEQLGGIEKETSPQVQAGKVAVATAEGQARANIEAQAARGSNAEVANVAPRMVSTATTAADKADADYAQAKSVTDRLNAMMQAARRGNVVSYQVIPEEGTLQITTSQGVHRINQAEIAQYAGGGSLWQRLQGHFGKQLTGASIPSSVLDDMAEIQNIQAQGSREKYENTLKSLNRRYGATFQPVDMESGPSNQGGPKTKADPLGIR